MTTYASSAWLNAIPKLTNADESKIEKYRKLSARLLLGEPPQLINALLERTCNLQCLHCLLPPGKSSEKISLERHLKDTIKNLTIQISKNPPHDTWKAFLHEGRIVRPWHINLLSELRTVAPNVQLGLIDNGTYVAYLEHFKKLNLKLSWLDISCDGTKKIHNMQRDPIRHQAFDQMMEGLEHGREITLDRSEGGRVTALMTLTSINYNDVGNVAEMMFTANPNNKNGLSYADEFHVTTMTPHQPANYKIEINGTQLRRAFDQTLSLQDLRRANGSPKVYFRLYSAKHLGLLVEQIGSSEFRKAFGTAKAYPHGIVKFVVLGLPMLYMPNSIWPAEGIFIDADSAQRVAYAQKNTLKQLGEDTNLAKYTINPHLDPKSKLETVHAEAVSTWHNYFAYGFLKDEIETVKMIMK